MGIDRNRGKESESGKRRKAAPTRAISPLALGRRWPRPWPTQLAAILREPGAFPAPPRLGTGALRLELGPPLNIREAAALIGCSPWTVRQTLVPRGLPVFRSTASGRLIFYRNQIVAWIEKQQGGQQNQ